MCNRRTRTLLEQIVREKCGRGEMFTAFDISCLAQQLGCAERHRQMKQVVHEAYTNGLMGPDYERVLVHIPGAEPAWLYYHEDDDPNLYGPMRRGTTRHDHPSLRLTLPRTQPSSNRARRPARRTVFSLLSFFNRCPHCSAD